MTALPARTESAFLVLTVDIFHFLTEHSAVSLATRKCVKPYFTSRCGGDNEVTTASMAAAGWLATVAALLSAAFVGAHGE